MAKTNPDVEMIAAPNMLQIKIGGPIGAADLHLIEKADNALNEMRSDFALWLEDEVEKLEKSASIVRKEGLKGQEGEDLFIRAHDLRGLGSTYEFPIITRLASSMAKMIDMPEKREVAPAGLVLAHVNAIRAALVQNIRDTTDPVAAELAGQLEEMAEAFAAPWKDQPQPAAANG
ncbi:Hpt domain-containing protein [uncultured Maricaulis sp.]|uniref:Hpt domain-containing protein n=1 Tax=uncultured Maricaulis sp. TaxID=174710 RepID=UPI0030DA78F0|tara:strand:+ start:22730 stop:23254 length:525 start_codon:yes stop_codon:yes gene_type:complete